MGDVKGELGFICAGGGRESVGWGRGGVVGGGRGVEQGMELVLLEVVGVTFVGLYLEKECAWG